MADFDAFEAQFHTTDGERPWRDIPAERGNHIFDVWEHLAWHLAEDAVIARDETGTPEGMYLLPNGTSLAFRFSDHDIIVQVQYPQDVINEAIEALEEQ